MGHKMLRLGQFKGARYDPELVLFDILSVMDFSALVHLQNIVPRPGTRTH